MSLTKSHRPPSAAIRSTCARAIARTRFHRLHPLILEQGREELAQHAMFRLVRSRQALEREGVTVIDRAHPLDRLDLAEDERLGGGVVEVVGACDFEHIGVLGDHSERLDTFRPSDPKRLDWKSRRLNSSQLCAPS